MLPVIAGGAAGLAPGLAAATAPMYGENIGRLEQDPTLSGVSAGQKALHAAPTAAVQGALNYVVPVRGECQPREDALQLSWVTPEEALSADIQAEFAGGRGRLIEQALAHVGWGR